MLIITEAPTECQLSQERPPPVRSHVISYTYKLLEYTSHFLTSCDDHANLRWLKDLLTCGRQDLLASCSSGTLLCTCVVVREDLGYFFMVAEL